jgi:hypothetical protein
MTSRGPARRALVGLLGCGVLTAAAAAPALARPYKIDTNANVCEAQSGSISHRSDGVNAVSTAVIFCPIDIVTWPTDPTGSNVNVSFKALYKNASSLYCDLEAYWQGSYYYAPPAGSSGGVVYSTPVAWPLPGAGSESPYEMFIYCSLPTGVTLTAIQITTN